MATIKTPAGLTKQTPQTEPIFGAGQVQNNAGGYGWELNCWKQLERFLILGCSGTYYSPEEKLTKENADAVLQCLSKDGITTVNRIVDISYAGRAAKNDPAIFALALAASFGTPEVKSYALANLSKVCRIGTHLFHFAEYVNGMRGWGSALRKAVARWYTEQDNNKLALQVVKYQQRDGWSHFDLLRLSHPETADNEKEAIFRWIAKKPFVEHSVTRSFGTKENPRKLNCTYNSVEGRLPAIIKVVESLTKDSSSSEVIEAIDKFGLTHEMIPTEFKKNPDIWDALLRKMPLTAMIRNLGNMTAIGTLKPLSYGTHKVINALKNEDNLKKARIHPLQVLIALKTYAQGHGDLGKNSWSPVQTILSALDEAFYKCFKYVEPTNKNYLLALDVSGSMGCGACAGAKSLTPRVGAAAMALAMANVEPNYHILGFSHELVPVNIGRGCRLDQAIKAMERIPMGGTDCALPMVWALKNKVVVDTFCVYTDNETWFGNIHPSQALKEYRKHINPNAKLAVVGMTGDKFTIADPKDGGMLDLVGFDSFTPNIIAEFSKGNI